MYDNIIIGAGICGLTAAMYASRKKMNFEVIAKEFGGQFMISGEILNYPGITKTTGFEFSKIMLEQMGFNKVNARIETAEKIEKIGTNFKVITDKNKYETKTVIIATGSSPRKINVPGEKEYAKKGVTYCSVCDGPLFAGMDVAIVGGGNSALGAVDFLKDIASKIYVIVKDDKFIGHEYLIERVKNNPKVEVFFNSETTEIFGEQLVTGLKFKQNGEEKQLNVKGVIIEIGRIPNTDFVKEIVKLDMDNHIQIDCQTRTTVPGIFAAGDCASGHEYQYVISAGQGCMALLKTARYLAYKK